MAECPFYRKNGIGVIKAQRWYFGKPPFLMAPTGEPGYSTSDSHNAAPAPINRKKAVLIGVNYPPKSDEDLSRSTHTDVHLWESALQRDWSWSAQNIVCITDEPGQEGTDLWPTIANILTQIEALFTNTRPGDQLLLFIAAHGLKSHPRPSESSIQTAESDGSAGILCGHTIMELINKNLISGVNLTVILDTCYAAGFLNLPHRLVIKEDKPVCENLESYSSQTRGEILCISACGALEETGMVQLGSDETQKAGLLTMLTLHHLQQSRNEGTSCLKALLEKLEAAPSRLGYKQTPVITCSAPSVAPNFSL